MRYTQLIWLPIVMLAISSVTVVADNANVAFEELDNDGDGFISKSEATSRADLRQVWNSVDANRDGKLTEVEFSAFETIPQDAFSEK